MPGGRRCRELEATVNELPATGTVGIWMELTQMELYKDLGKHLAEPHYTVGAALREVHQNVGPVRREAFRR